MTSLPKDLKALSDTLDDFVDEYGMETLESFINGYLKYERRSPTNPLHC